MSKVKTSDGRTRNYATVVYPESAPADWLQILERHCVPCFVSPLHDKDENATGEPKKPHHHVMLMFENKKTPEQAREVFDTIGGVGCEVVKSVRAYARYLCHLDNPDKAQYDPNEVKAISADYLSCINLSVDRYAAIKEMHDFISYYDVQSFSLLFDYASRKRPDWYRVLCDSSTYVIKEYIKSRQWSSDNGVLVIVDPQTGEPLLSDDDT